jgi:hypothetical protein
LQNVHGVRKSHVVSDNADDCAANRQIRRLPALPVGQWPERREWEAKAQTGKTEFQTWDDQPMDERDPVDTAICLRNMIL